MTVPAPPVSLYHLDWPHAKHEENSVRGMHEAVRLGKRWIDLDNLIDKEDVSWCTHWPLPMLRDGFYDPLHKLDPHTRVADMTTAEVERLRTHDEPPYRIGRSTRRTIQALDLGLGVEFECKSAHYSRDYFARLWATVSGERVVVKAAPNFLPSLAHAHAAGFPTIVLSHGRPVPRKAAPFLTYHRGAIRWTEGPVWGQTR